MDDNDDDCNDGQTPTFDLDIFVNCKRWCSLIETRFKRLEQSIAPWWWCDGGGGGWFKFVLVIDWIECILLDDNGRWFR